MRQSERRGGETELNQDAAIKNAGSTSTTTDESVVAEAANDEQIDFFEKHIRPVLIKHCYECHSSEADEFQGGLALDSRAGLLEGGETGPAVVPGQPKQSRLLEAISYNDKKLRMPPDTRLPEEVVAQFETWINNGAVDPRTQATASSPESTIDWEQGKQHWSFQPITQPDIPVVANTDWPRTEIDKFVWNRLNQNSLQPVQDASRLTLLRRLSFDLTGLPPSRELVEQFSSANPDELKSIVDQLLASPTYGEKWGRHWLDVARYAESTGKTVNFYYPHAWRYRDYVIDSFNNDKPFDQFIVQQLAGDLLPSQSKEEAAQNIIATGFLALGPKTLNERNGLKFELDVADEQIDVTTQAFLGLTVACARCHDHKFDPISQADYYAMAGIFRSTETHYGTVRYINAQRVTSLIDLPESDEIKLAVEPLSDRSRQRIESQIDSVKASMKKSRDGLQIFFASGRLSLLESKLDAYQEDGSPRYLAMGVQDKRAKPVRQFGRNRMFGDFSFDGSRSIADSPVYIRGESDQPSKTSVPRGCVQILCKTPLEIEPKNSGRLELAHWIASGENPLTARVIVNRIWLQLFGRGLVPTADNFGLAGRPPSHPELLDYLALRLIENQWSIKQLIREIVLSRVYQLDSISNPDCLASDPENQWLWRMAPRRLDAECLRDAMLAASGELERNPPTGSAVALAGEGPVSQPFMRRNPTLQAIEDPRNPYRSVYLPAIRDLSPQAMVLFDAADPSLITANRSQTTVPSQGLYLLNNDFVMRMSVKAAAQLLKLDEPNERVHFAFIDCYGRPPTEHEIQSSLEFVAAYSRALESGSEQKREREAWSAFCQALFASADFQYRR